VTFSRWLLEATEEDVRAGRVDPAKVAELGAQTVADCVREFATLGYEDERAALEPLRNHYGKSRTKEARARAVILKGLAPDPRRGGPEIRVGTGFAARLIDCLVGLGYVGADALQMARAFLLAIFGEDVKLETLRGRLKRLDGPDVRPLKDRSRIGPI
jgi:hypothetical protein